jgi:hypothetical protein
MTEPPNEMFTWEEGVEAIYAEVVAEADPETGTTRRAATAVAAERILHAIDDGDLKPDMLDIVKRALSHADETHGKRGDKLIEETVTGAITLFDCDAQLNTVVTLGRGLRKLWRYINEDDIISMDELRADNLRKQEDAYWNSWRPYFEPARRALRQHQNIENAISSGAFGASSGGFEGA